MQHTTADTDHDGDVRCRREEKTATPADAPREAPRLHVFSTHCQRIMRPVGLGRCRRERETEKQRERERDRERDRETERQRETERERETERLTD